MTAYSAPGIPCIGKVDPVKLTDMLIIELALTNYYFFSGYNVTFKALKCRSRDHELKVYPRMIINALLRDFKGYMLREIGLIWMLDHATVLHSIKQLKQMCKHQKLHPVVKSYQLTHKLISQGIENKFYTI